MNFVYPQLFETEYIILHVRLEIGPLAEWMLSHITSIIPFAAEQYGQLFEQRSTDILTIDAERTFWEKITILRKELLEKDVAFKQKFYYAQKCAL